MSVIKITSDNFQQEVMQSDKPVLVDFFATWCGPCQMLSPIVDEVAEEVTDKKVCKIDIDESPELAQKFGVMSVPTLILFKDGEVVKKESGARPKKSVLDIINS